MKSYMKHTMAAMLTFVLSATAFAQVPVMVLEVEEDGEIVKKEYPLDDGLDMKTFGRNNMKANDYARLVDHWYSLNQHSAYLEVEGDAAMAESGGSIGVIVSKSPNITLDWESDWLFYFCSVPGSKNIKTFGTMQYSGGQFYGVSSFEMKEPFRASNSFTHPLKTDSEVILNPGETIYCRPFYSIPGIGNKYGNITKIVLPNTMKTIKERAACAAGNFSLVEGEREVGIDFDVDDVKADVEALLGSGESAYYALGKRFFELNKEMIENESHVCLCVDGYFYTYKMTKEEVKDMLKLMEEEAKHEYIATIESVNYDVNSRKSYIFTKNFSTIDYVETDASWGIPNNRYIKVVPSQATTNPYVAFDLQHVLIPGKTYNITLRIAPDTEAKTPEERKGNRFYVNLFESSTNAPYDLNTSGTRISNPDGVSGAYFDTKADELTEFTFSYTPQSAFPRLAIQLQSQITNAKLNEFSRTIRLVDISVDEVK